MTKEQKQVVSTQIIMLNMSDVQELTRLGRKYCKKNFCL